MRNKVYTFLMNIFTQMKMGFLLVPLVPLEGSSTCHLRTFFLVPLIIRHAFIHLKISIQIIFIFYISVKLLYASTTELFKNIPS